MNIQIKRVAQGTNSSLGHLYIQGVFVCYLLEDKPRKEKLAGITAIPEGTYKLKLRKFGLTHQKYLDRYPSLHKGMLEICGIPNFCDVLLHIGNVHQETEGCPLTGSYWVKKNDDYLVRQSRRAYEYVYPLLLEELKKGNNRITIKNQS